MGVTRGGYAVHVRIPLVELVIRTLPKGGDMDYDKEFKGKTVEELMRVKVCLEELVCSGMFLSDMVRHLHYVEEELEDRETGVVLDPERKERGKGVFEGLIDELVKDLDWRG